MYTLDKPLPHKPPLEGFLSAVRLLKVSLELRQRWLPQLDTLSLVFISTSIMRQVVFNRLLLEYFCNLLEEKMQRYWAMWKLETTAIFFIK